MKRLQSRKELKYYTYMRQVLQNLELKDKDYWWLICDIEAYPTKEKYVNLLENNDYLLLSTKELVEMLDDENFQWVWAVFSAIPSMYSKEEILKYDLPFIQPFRKENNPFFEIPKIQHPLAEFEIGAWDSSALIIITESKDLLDIFKKSYPLSN